MIDIARLQAQWRDVTNRAYHGPGCGCCGAQPVMIDQAGLREDIEFALRARYVDAGLDDRTIALDALVDEAGQGVGSWLDQLAASRQHAILADIAAILDSMDEAQRRGR